MVDMLGFISDQLDQLGIPYEFGSVPVFHRLLREGIQ